MDVGGFEVPNRLCQGSFSRRWTRQTSTERRASPPSSARQLDQHQSDLSIRHLSPLIFNPSNTRHNAQEVRTQSILGTIERPRGLYLTRQHSGIARSLRASAFRRPAALQRSFQPLKPSFASALSQRFASTDSTKDGRIHQVIGAVVDGTRKAFPLELRQAESSCWGAPDGR